MKLLAFAFATVFAVSAQAQVEGSKNVNVSCQVLTQSLEEGKQTTTVVVPLVEQTGKRFLGTYRSGSDMIQLHVLLPIAKNEAASTHIKVIVGDLRASAITYGSSSKVEVAQGKLGENSLKVDCGDLSKLK